MTIIFTGISGYEYPHTRVRCYHFSRELVRHGLKSEVLSYRDTLKPVFSEVQMYGIPDRWKIILNMKALRYLLQRKNSTIYLQKIHYHAAVPLMLARMGTHRLVFDLDDWDEGCLCLFRNPLLNRLFFGGSNYRRIVEKAAALSDFCVVASHSLKEVLDRMHRRVYLLHTGVDSDRFSYLRRPHHEEIVCGWTGLVWGDTVLKSVLMMLECFSRAWRREPRLRLRLIGAGQLMPLIRQEIHLHYDDVPVEIVDWIHPDRMVDELHRFDIGLLPLITSGEDEMWIRSKSPTKFFEFLSTGLPTVASDIGEVRHIVENGHNGFLASSADEFTERILTLAGDEKLRTTMGENGRKTIEASYNLSSLGSRLAGLFGAGQSDSPVAESRSSGTMTGGANGHA